MDIAGLQRKRDEAIAQAEEEYAAAFRIFYAYQNYAPELAPEFSEAEMAASRRKRGGVLSANEMKLQIERDRLEIYHQALNNMERLGDLLDPGEVKRIQEKIKKNLDPRIQAIVGGNRIR